MTKLSWEEYQKQFPAPYNIEQYIGRPLSEYPANYDEMRKANLKWQAEYFTKGYSQEGASAFHLLNPFIAGGWYYGMGGAEWIPNPNPTPEVDWAAEAAAGRPVIGPAVPATPRVGMLRRLKRKLFG